MLLLILSTLILIVDMALGDFKSFFEGLGLIDLSTCLTIEIIIGGPSTFYDWSIFEDKVGFIADGGACKEEMPELLLLALLSLLIEMADPPFNELLFL